MSRKYYDDNEDDDFGISNRPKKTRTRGKRLDHKFFKKAEKRELERIDAELTNSIYVMDPKNSQE